MSDRSTVEHGRGHRQTGHVCGSGDKQQRIEELFTLPGRELRRRARIEDGELATLVEQAIDLRNRMVHRWHVLSAIEVASGRYHLGKRRPRLRPSSPPRMGRPTTQRGITASLRHRDAGCG